MNKVKSNKVLRFGASLLALALLSTVMMGGCPANAAKEGPSDVRYVNMATHGQMATSTFQLDTVNFGPVNQYSETGYEVFENTNNSIPALAKDKDGNTVFATTDFEVSGGYQTNIIALGKDTTVEVALVDMAADRDAPGAGEVHFSFVNGVEETFGVDIYVVNVGESLAGKTPIVSGITYTESSQDTMTFDGAGKDLVACFHGTTTEMFRTSVTLTGGTEYLAVMVSPAGLPGSFKVLNFNEVF